MTTFEVGQLLKDVGSFLFLFSISAAILVIALMFVFAGIKDLRK